MSEPATPRVTSNPKRWSGTLAWLTSGLLVVETLTGLIVWLLPFSLTAQISLLVHVAVGLPWVIPLCWYLVRHWSQQRSYAMNHYKATGYAALVGLAICVVSGLVLTWQSLFGTRITPLWDQLHLYSTFAIVAFTAPHVLLLIFRERKRSADAPLRIAANAHWRRIGWTTLAGAGAVGLALLVYQPPEFIDEFPEDYSFKYGEDRPFAPSLARTDTGEAYDKRSLSGSESCGTTNCHEQITKEWSVSAHRWAAMDVAFQTVQGVMAEQNGAESTRYCGGCHDPISLFAGVKGIFTDGLTSEEGYHEGISCLACHGINETDLTGNANYEIKRTDRYLLELGEGPAAKLVSDFLIRSYPDHHVDTLAKRLFKTPEYCAACHKQFIDEEVNQVGWVQLQNQFDNWRKSRWNKPGHPEETIECRECHMPLVDSTDPAAGDALDYNRTTDDGKHRSHRFLAANQMMPLLLELEGAEEQARLSEAWLRGEIEIPEIGDKWKTGPAVPIELVAPKQAQPGETIAVAVNITSNKVGHDFPTGPLDIIQAWVELEVTDWKGQVVFHSGQVDEKNFIEPGSFLFKAEAVDQYGNLIDRHNLWEMVGVRYRRSLFPGFADAAQFSFNCPSVMTTAPGQKLEDKEFAVTLPDGESGELTLRARLRYRKIDQFLLNFLFGEDTALTSPITDMSWAETTIQLTPAS